MVRKRTVLSRSRSSDQMNLAPVKYSRALVKDSFGLTRASGYSVAWAQPESSKSTAYQFVGMGSCRTLGLAGVAVERAFEETLRLPLRVGDGPVGELDDQAGVTDVVAVFQARLRVGVVHRHHRDRHRVFGQDVDRHDIVGHVFDRVDHAELAVDEQDEPVVRVDVELQGVGWGRLDEAGRVAGPAFAAFALAAFRPVALRPVALAGFRLGLFAGLARFTLWPRPGRGLAGVCLPCPCLCRRSPSDVRRRDRPRRPGAVRLVCTSRSR